MATITATATQVLAVAAGAAALWIVFAAAVALYGQSKGFPWFPLFLSAVFLSWPLVLLAVTVGGGVRPARVSDAEASRRLTRLAEADRGGR